MIYSFYDLLLALILEINLHKVGLLFPKPVSENGYASKLFLKSGLATLLLMKHFFFF